MGGEHGGGSGFVLDVPALGLVTPWQVTSVEFDKEAGELQIGLDFPRGSRFACPIQDCRQAACLVHDTVDKRWRHLDFFEHRAFLAARVPRVACGQQGIHLVEVPWARPGSGFTLLMEVAMLTFAKQMPIAPLAQMAREHVTRVWRVIEHHVLAARGGLDFSGVTGVGMDETSARRGQDYVSIFMDLHERRVMFATPGKDADTVKAFAADLGVHGGRPQTQVERVCADMSPAVIKGINEYLIEQPKTEEQKPQEEEEAGADTAVEVVEPAEAMVATGELHRPQIVFDRFHVVAKANEAVDEVRRAEARPVPS